MITLLNTSILTTCGQFNYKPITLENAREIVAPLALNRIQYVQNVGEVAIVFKLKGRAPEGVILSRQEVEAMGYEFGLLTRNA